MVEMLSWLAHLRAEAHLELLRVLALVERFLPGPNTGFGGKAPGTPIQKCNKNKLYYGKRELRLTAPRRPRPSASCMFGGTVRTSDILAFLQSHRKKQEEPHK